MSTNPKKLPVIISLSIFKYFINGGYFPKGGPKQIVNRLTSKIYECGGRILVGRKVSNIIIKNNKVIGVKMITGEEIKCKNVISSVGIINTFKHLIKNPNENPIISELSKNPPVDFNAIILFIGLKGSSYDLNLPSYNHWIFPDQN